MQTTFNGEFPHNKPEPEGTDASRESAASRMFAKSDVMDWSDRFIEHSKLPQSVDKFLQGHKRAGTIETLEPDNGRWKWINFCQVKVHLLN